MRLEGDGFCFVNLDMELSSFAGDQPQLIQGIRSGDGVGEDQETTA